MAHIRMSRCCCFDLEFIGPANWWCVYLLRVYDYLCVINVIFHTSCVCPGVWRWLVSRSYIPLYVDMDRKRMYVKRSIFSSYTIVISLICVVIKQYSNWSLSTKWFGLTIFCFVLKTWWLIDWFISCISTNGLQLPMVLMLWYAADKHSQSLRYCSNTNNHWYP